MGFIKYVRDKGTTTLALRGRPHAPPGGDVYRAMMDHRLHPNPTSFSRSCEPFLIMIENKTQNNFWYENGNNDVNCCTS